MACLPPTVTMHSLVEYAVPYSDLWLSQMVCFSSSVPPVLVYLVKFWFRASMAARLMLSGVGKSGSPAPKSTTSAPSRRRRSASAATFMVEDTLISEILEASSCTVCIRSTPSNFLYQVLTPRQRPPLHSLLNRGRHQPRDVSAQRSHLLHQVGADERMSFARQQKHGFDARVQTTVHQRHLQLVLVIGKRPDTAQDHIGRARRGVIDQQSFKRGHFNIRIRPHYFFEHLHPLRHRKQRPLGVVVENRDDQPLDQFAASRNQIQVPVGDRVKGTWIDGDSPGWWRVQALSCRWRVKDPF